MRRNVKILFGFATVWSFVVFYYVHSDSTHTKVRFVQGLFIEDQLLVPLRMIGNTMRYFFFNFICI